MSFDVTPRTRVVFGEGTLARLGELAQGLGVRRALLVADPGLVAAGQADAATARLIAAGIAVVPFHEFGENPTGAMVEAGAAFAGAEAVDGIVGLGGGSSLDCAKGINLLLTNGDHAADYHGYGKATRPLLPMLGIPTTAGTGSEAQSYALISNTGSHEKMACGDPQMAFRVAILDPELTLGLPPAVTASTGYDALSHAVESYVTRRHNAVSDLYAREAFRLLEPNYERVLYDPLDRAARGAMLLGAHWAGAAIEHSMLGATHACANPLTARHQTVHGVAIALLLPHVVRWNAEVAGERYAELMHAARRPGGADALATRLEELAAAGGLPRGLAAVGVRENELPDLAAAAADQWTGQFNPRSFDAAAALELYRCAL